MEIAECETVRNDWFSFWMPVRKDVRCVKQLFVTQAANCAAILIGSKHPPAEPLLVKAELHCSGYVAANCSSSNLWKRYDVSLNRLLGINGDREREVSRMITHDEDRPDRHVLARNHS